MRRFRSTLAIFCVWLMAAPVTWAQNNGNGSDRNGGPWLNLGGFSDRYRGQVVPPVIVSNSSRLDSLVRAGQLYLSLQDTIAAALENNIDIEIQRYGPRIAETDLLRARAGGFLRGVNQNVTSGAQSAGGTGVQGFAGGGGGGAGGGGFGGGAGQALSAGPNAGNLDPVMTGTLQWGHFSSPQTTNFLTGTTSLITRQKLYNFGVQQAFLTGTSASMGYNNNIAQSNNLRNDFNPVTSSNLELVISQRLLQGFGMAINNRNIRIAKNNIQVADLVFRQQVMNTVANVIALYWDLVAYNEDVAVRRQALALAEKLYNDNRKQVEIGTLAPIEIVRAEAEVAARQQDLTTSETNVLQQETILKNAISRNGVASPTVAEVRIVPTDRIRLPDVEAVQPIQDLTASALATRPELAQTQVQLDNSRIALTGTKNALLPSIDAFVSMRNRAQAGEISTLPLLDPVTGNLVPRNPAAVDSFFLGGYSTVLRQLFGRSFPDYSAGFQLNIPLRNRAAQADYTNAQLNLRQSELAYQRQINNVRVDVQNALIALQQARARYQAAEKNRALQEQTLDAEQKKYALGASTVFLVIQAQRDLAQAEASRVQALAAYARARTQLDLATGQTLEENNILVEEAKRGTVAAPPKPIPDLVPNGAAKAQPTVPINPSR
jgi:outer membrane protein